jgi:mannan endo-1,4-beta-mannosidase
MRSIVCGIAFLFAQYLGTAESQLVDPKATTKTKDLFTTLQSISDTGMLFGHQDATMYGVGWNAKAGEIDRSDIKSVVGAHPALYGWDMSRWPSGELGHGSDAFYREHIVAADERGGVNTFSWHLFNPVTGENFYDKTPAVANILPGGDRHEKYKSDLDTFAAFTRTLKDKNGIPIPIIFRPFHEHTGSWFWWGQNFCTADEYKRLWRFTVEYLRDVKGVHQFLYAYSPDRIKSSEEYFERYPGDDYVDILALDNYLRGENQTETEEMLVRLRLIVTEAEKRGKVAALSETGLEGIIDADWFTRVILNPIKNDPVARRIAYVLVWRNHSDTHFFAPYPGHKSAADFLKLYNDSFTVFGK